MKHVLRSRGICLTECVAVAAIFAITTAIIIPAAGSLNRGSMESDALGRIRRLSQAHSSYALDWNDQHVTYTKGDISAFGNSPSQAVAAWNTWNAQQGGTPDELDGYWHPSLKLGWGGEQGQCISTDEDQVFYAYRQGSNSGGNHLLLQPIGLFNSFSYIGSANFPNVRGLREYVGDKFFSRPFYSPLDTFGQGAIERPYSIPRALPDCDFEFVSENSPPWCVGCSIPTWSSFALSPAAMYNPEVMPQSGIRDPWSFDEGFQSPNLSQCRYPSQKTEWLQIYPSYPDRFCSDSGQWNGVHRGPYSCFETNAYVSYESQVDTVVPAAFFDGSVLLSLNRQYSRDNSRVKHLQTNKQAKVGLTHQPPRINGYTEETLGHHNFTVDGILGRDLLDRSPAPNIR